MFDREQADMFPGTEPKIKTIKADIMNDTTASNEKDNKAATPTLQVARASDIRNPWVCLNCGAILGSVLHEKVRTGLSISRLILFRGAVKVDELLPANFIFGKVESGEFGCSRCGDVRVWKPSPETLRYLMNGNGHHVRKKHKNL